MEVFVARQPIFNIKEEVFGYELLYRSSFENKFPNIDDDQATAELIITSFLNIGIDSLSNGKPCFINFTEKLMQLRLPTYFRPRDIVVEILESVPIDAKLLEICKELKSLGYKIALDDFILNEMNPFSRKILKYTDIIKVDFLNTTREMRAQIETIANFLHVELLAEKVETQEMYKEAKAKGYHYFQGYFFARPVIVSSYDVPLYFHTYYEIIQNLAHPEPNIDTISKLIEQDLSLSYKLLKLINSPAFRPKAKINSIRQAIVLLGLIEIQKWIYVLAVREINRAQSPLSEELIRICLTRGKMCEEIAILLDHKSSRSGSFLTGMFSMMDAVMGLPMEKIVSELPLDEDITLALMGKDNFLGNILDIVIKVEKGNWKESEQKCKELNLDQDTIYNLYKKSIDWSNLLLNKETTKNSSYNSL